MKKLFPILMTLVFVGAGCIPAAQAPQVEIEELPTVEDLQGTTQQMPAGDFDGVDEMIVVEEEGDNEASEQEEMQDQQQTSEDMPSGESVKITVVAKNWEFEPSVITVKEGQTLDMQIISIDVEHGFSLPDFGINKTLKPGQVEVFSFVADKKGTFSFTCSVFCGEGHRQMTGTLIVE